MKLSQKKWFTKIALSVVAVSTLLFLNHCADESATSDSFSQIERLGRPAINEGLVRTNAFLVAFNSIPPSSDLSATAVLNHVIETLDALDAADGTEHITATAVAGGFLPDVMRIDTSKSIAVTAAAYNGCTCTEATTGATQLCCGRKIEDDVMDITRSFLIAGDATGAAFPDNVSYPGTTGGGTDITDCTTVGENAAVTGHQCLFGQTTRKGAASFPFLAKPN